MDTERVHQMMDFLREVISCETMSDYFKNKAINLQELLIQQELPLEQMELLNGSNNL